MKIKTDDVLYVRIDNQQELDQAIQKAEKNRFFRINENIPTYEQAKSNYHGNSKLILHLFPNNILKRCEWQISTISTIKSYLNNRKVKWIDATKNYLN